MKWTEDLKRLRDVGWTWPQIAEACGVSVNTAQSWGSGRYTPSGAAQKLLRIAAGGRPDVQENSTE